MERELLRSQQAKKVTLVGFWANAGLSLLKLVAGILGRSNAMIADGVHSLSDFLTDIIVIIGFKLTEKPEDHDHNYGHDKYETLATVMVSIALLVAAIGIFKSGMGNIMKVVRGETIHQPGVIALAAAVISILVKEILYRYTIKIGNEINSGAVKANAWHHRSDAFSSIGTMIGIGGAIVLGEKWAILDPIASLAVSVLIVKVAVEIFLPAINELLETSLDPEEMEWVKNVLRKEAGVVGFHEVRARKLGNKTAVEFHIMVDPLINITDAHDISTDIEDTLKDKFGENSIVTVHIEPYSEEEAQNGLHYEINEKA
ncbi:cation diffusion facilitator family transporter [Fusibacter ferrireducens]|uniref:Cation transporter n=1 Tax=Fusibacter ferrireducens TaxID=2785058 RepID=A0ABR9ZZ43_9FIRM|nr:cation diffusion facilitator family transporter [Fusibacter ferrireducens]MBF4695722.1 cation transporter [Fusibacter ferrireducens]